MKILVDIDDLEKTGVVTPELAASLRANAAREIGTLVTNVVVILGAIAIAAGTIALFPSASTGALCGIAYILAGWFLKKNCIEQWQVLGSILMIMGALLLATSTCIFINKPIVGPICAAIILGLVSLLAGSRLLAALVPLALAAAIGGSQNYWFFLNGSPIHSPTLYVILFSALAWGAWQYTKKRGGIIKTLALFFCGMCIILVNFGFWEGSIHGDSSPLLIDSIAATWYYNTGVIPSFVFLVVWAIVLLLAGGWGIKHGRRFMVNTSAVFFAILFISKWFDLFGLKPVSIVLSGVATVAWGLGLWRYNRKELVTQPAPAELEVI